MKLSPCTPGMIAQLLPETGIVLEVGCGSGELLNHLQKTGHYLLFGVEPDRETVRQAAKTAGVCVKNGAAEALPYESCMFNAVILECVFSLCSPVQAAAEVARVLKPGGLVLVADLYAETADTVLKRSRMIKNLYLRQTLEGFFRSHFDLEQYQDYTRQLREMFLQMMMEQTMCDCIAVHELPVLKMAKVGYGVWVWKK